jgi:hypothetical protein
MARETTLTAAALEEDPLVVDTVTSYRAREGMLANICIRGCSVEVKSDRTCTRARMNSLTAKAQDGGSAVLPWTLLDIPGAAYCLEVAIDAATSVAVGTQDIIARRRSSNRVEVEEGVRVDDDGCTYGSIASAACSSLRETIFRELFRAAELREKNAPCREDIGTCNGDSFGSDDKDAIGTNIFLPTTCRRVEIGIYCPSVASGVRYAKLSATLLSTACVALRDTSSAGNASSKMEGARARRSSIDAST